MIRKDDSAGLIRALTPLAFANPPPANDAKQLAGNMAHAARLVRSIVEDRLAELTEAGKADAPLQAVRDEFREVLYAHPQAAGYDAKRFDPLFAAAFERRRVKRRPIFSATAPLRAISSRASRGPTMASAWADPDKVRRQLYKLLAEARAAQSKPPWNKRDTRMYQITFPQMANWLPYAEAEQLRLEFQTEMERLSLAHKS